MTFEELCRNIDWLKMAKGRKSVKNLALNKPSLKYIADFLDALAESAVDEHGMNLSTVYPDAIKARLIGDLKKKEAFDNITKSFFTSQNKRRQEDGSN